MTAAVPVRETLISADPAVLEESRAYCRDLTRRHARNFYHGLKLLPAKKRAAMYALYAYMRLVDDIVDADGRSLEQRKADLDDWESLTHSVIDSVSRRRDSGAISAITQDHLLWPAFAEMLGQYQIPPQVFDDMIAGQRQDLEAVVFPDFSALHAYCYRVASVVGVASLYVWGFEGGEETLKLGIDRGIAFQLTNILRDLREDAGRGRCYLPQDEMERFGIEPDQIASGKASRELLDLMRFQIDRARDFYTRSAALDRCVHRDAQPTLRTMTDIYRGVLEAIARDPERALRRRVGLSSWAKLRIVWRALHGGNAES